MSEKIPVNLTNIIADLHKGVTRKISSRNYNSELGSIEEKYGLPPSQVDRLFKHPDLLNVRTKPVIEDMFVIVPDEETTTEEPVSETPAEPVGWTSEEEPVTEPVISLDDGDLSDFI